MLNWKKVFLKFKKRGTNLLLLGLRGYISHKKSKKTTINVYHNTENKPAYLQLVTVTLTGAM